MWQNKISYTSDERTWEIYDIVMNLDPYRWPGTISIVKSKRVWWDGYVPMIKQGGNSFYTVIFVTSMMFTIMKPNVKVGCVESTFATTN
jgi:hypothetical protein